MSGQFVCELCGAISFRRDCRQRWCKECRRNRQSEINRISDIEYKAREKALAAAVAPKPAPVAEPPKYTLAEVNAAARQCNMTYGYYMANWKLGNVPDPEKMPPPKKKRGRPCKCT